MPSDRGPTLVMAAAKNGAADVIRFAVGLYLPRPPRQD